MTFERVAPGYREAIDHARSRIPEAIRARVAHTHFLTGVCPNYVGLHHYVQSDTPGTSAWTYSQMAHAGLDSEGHSVIVLPLPFHEMKRIYWNDPGLTNTIIHELGHVLDRALRWRPAITPVTQYAAGNRREAFAEAFEMWHRWPTTLLQRAPEATAFFEELAA